MGRSAPESATVFQRTSTTYVYNWNFEKNVAELKTESKETGNNRMETDEFSFNTGILKYTKHSMKIFLFIEEEVVVLKIDIDDPTLQQDYTHSKLKLRPFTVVPVPNPNLPNNVKPKNALTETPPKEFIENNIFQPGELSGNECNPNGCANLLYNSMEYGHDYSGLIFTFKFRHCYWSEAVTETHVSKTQNNILLPKSFTVLNTDSLLNDNKFTDFKIICGDSTFQAHKIELANRSAVFAAMFEHPVSETVAGTINIEDFESKTVYQFLKFLYTGSGDLDNYASDLLLMADKYCVTDLKQLCEKHLTGTVNCENVMDFYKLGQLTNSEQLSLKCLETITRNKIQLFKNAKDIINFLEAFPAAYHAFFE